MQHQDIAEKLTYVSPTFVSLSVSETENQTQAADDFFPFPNNDLS